LRELKWILIG